MLGLENFVEALLIGSVITKCSGLISEVLSVTGMKSEASEIEETVSFSCLTNRDGDTSALLGLARTVEVLMLLLPDFWLESESREMSSVSWEYEGASDKMLEF